MMSAPPTGEVVDTPMDGTDALERGRHAFDERSWVVAYESLAGAAASGALLAEDLERLAIAAYLAGHELDSTEAWARAHAAHLERDEPPAAARCAFWLGFGLLQRGETAQGGGWLARARRVLDEHGVECAERGYLLIPDALMAMHAGDHHTALAHFDVMDAIAHRHGDRDLAAFSALGRGQVLLRLGDTLPGVALFDEVMVSATADELSPVVAGIVYCAVIEECNRVFDVRRAQEWTDALDRWCAAQPGLVPYRGQCLVHRSQVMQLHGEWRKAMDAAEQARDRLAEPRHPAIGMAHYQLAELHRLRGELDEAERAYRRAHEHGRSPQPGLALVQLARGRANDAAAAIARAIDEVHEPDRAALLPASVEIMLAADRVADARAAAGELAALAVDTAAAALTAAADQCRGAVLLAEGDARGALEALRGAWRGWQELQAPFEAARTRVLIAMACQALDDHDMAQLEFDAARRAFEQLGAAAALIELERRRAPAESTSGGVPVSERELEVLRLVAQGMTNREIAAALVISDKTVERHVSNISTKLGVTNRTAAAAYAYRHGLL